MRLALAVCCAAVAGCATAATRVTSSRGQQLQSPSPGLDSAMGGGSNATATGSAIDYGSLTCMHWTGGTCLLSTCKPERGPTVCESGKCMCQPGSCADAVGACIPNSKGEWIGEYAIRFMEPSLPHTAYLGLGSGSSVISGPPGMIAGLGTIALNTKQWKIALTPNGRVRLQNTAHPDSVLTIYSNRRRGFLQTSNHGLTSKARQGNREQMANSSSGSSSAHDAAKKGKKTFGSYDLWPALVKLEKACPFDATFQVRPTVQDGGGLEIWDPHTKVAIANTNGEGTWTADAFDVDGIGECVDPQSGDCLGRQLVEFEPPLPAKARETAVRAIITRISTLYLWQTVMIVLCCICTFCLSQWLEAGGAEAMSRRVREVRAAPAAPAGPPPRPLVYGRWTLTSELGSFEYQFNSGDNGTVDPPEPVTVRGKAADGTWDDAMEGTWQLEATRWWRPGNSGPRWVLRFQGPDETNFEIDFINSDTLRGTATASDASMSFEGSRNND